LRSTSRRLERWRARAALAGIIALVANGAHGECGFDAGYFKRETYAARPEVDTIVWLADEKQARIITREHDLVSVTHWTCDELGLEAHMLVDPDPGDDDALKHKLDELADIVLAGGELASFSAAEKGGTDLSGAQVDIPGAENMPEFYYTVQRLGGFAVITIKYYYN